MKEIEVTGLRKEYGSFTAVEGLDFEIERARFSALLVQTAPGRPRHENAKRINYPTASAP